MKMIVISDSYFYRNAFSGVNDCITVSPDDVTLISREKSFDFYVNSVIVLSISDKDIMLNVLAFVILQKALAIFIEPVQWPSRARVFYTCNVFILPGKMRMEHLLTVIRKCLLSTSGVFRISLERVKSSEWSAMLYLISGISNRHLAQMLNASEKTISGRIKSLAIKMGLSDLNKATQLNAMNLFYGIYISRKSAEERNYFKKQQALVSESVRNWLVTV
ncbi:hypothetical protein FHW31_003662 [Enterobacter asburiae]|uniref:hypothetical protein n=1 Tax=Enterobacter asburiae TaxID=61645 RepID=UPI001D6AF96C|nr:hypothetical protein [Enterobacter asburiae]NIH92187.1 hypothetical protein [Enterobacter asburiae]